MIGLPGQVRQKVVSYEETHEDPIVDSPLEVVGEGQVRHLQVSPVRILMEFLNTKIAPKKVLTSFLRMWSPRQRTENPGSGSVKDGDDLGQVSS